MESNVAFTDAVARARQIAAKLGTGATGAGAPPSQPPVSNPLTGGLESGGGNPNNIPLGSKRSFPGGPDGGDANAKRFAGGDPDAITAQLRAIADQQRSSAVDAAKTAAAQVAAKINQSLGSASGGGGGGGPSVGAHPGLGMVQSEDMAVPNKMVGLGGGGTTFEMMIPASKVGLVIGKGGETIKKLQQQSNCKMLMIQDGAFQNAPEKPLRINGDPQTVQMARKIVQDLLDSKDNAPPGQQGGGQYGGGYAEGAPTSIPVPRECVGIIIGKQGEMIKRIQGKFNVRIQFQKDVGGDQRLCDLTGRPDAVHEAKQHIHELIQENNNRDRQQGGAQQRQGARPGFGGPRNDGGYEEHTTMRVPAEKCGIVIGKGGETIRQICQISGAHVELNRNLPQNVPEKEFNITGNPDQIQHAMQLIGEKAQMQPNGGRGAGGPPGAWGGGHPPQNGGGPPQQGGWGGPPAPHGGGGPPGGYPGGPQQQPPQQQQQQQQGGWGNYNYNQWGQQQQQQQGQQPPAGDQQSQQDQQAWQAYYAQYYSQYPQGQQQPGPGAPSATGPAAPQPATSQPAAPSSNAPTNSTAPAPSINPSTGQPDYSEAWAAYYRQMGWHDQAEAVLKQARTGGGDPASAAS